MNGEITDFPDLSS